MTEEDKCNRCGKCCHYMFKGKLKRCKYLRNEKEDLFSCVKYPKQVGTVLERNPLIICKRRIKSSYNYEDCPYNEDTPGLPMFKEG